MSGSKHKQTPSLCSESGASLNTSEHDSSRPSTGSLTALQLIVGVCQGTCNVATANWFTEVQPTINDLVVSIQHASHWILARPPVGGWAVDTARYDFFQPFTNINGSWAAASRRTLTSTLFYAMTIVRRTREEQNSLSGGVSVFVTH